MEELSLVWIVAGFFTAIALRNIFFKVLSAYKSADDYSKDVAEILNKDEHKVKGRFE